MDRVLAGARFLDTQARGWRRRIRRRDLNMAEGSYEGPGTCGCIVAQLAEDGDYNTGLSDLGVDDDYALGFMADTDAEFMCLTNAWRRVLRDNLR